ncbi:bifunctional oligoribonuclease/PAP phosphatase NrnA [candidate division KSB1 bacterium]|nr:bifunctional oligoribonuclease/PAP phosphatase NrnA [candidate division KSB1 bacterium]
MDLRRLEEFLLANDDFLITTHVNPDGDALCSVLIFHGLLLALGKRARVIINDRVFPKYRFLPNSHLIQPVGKLPKGVQKKFKHAVILDCGELDRIGRVSELLEPQVKVLNIDHHTSNGQFGALNWVDPQKSSTAEMLYYLLKALGVTIDRGLAELIFVGVMTDTGRFRFSNTTQAVFQIAGEMVELGVNPQQAAEKVYFERSIRELKALGNFFLSLEPFFEGRVYLGYLKEGEKAIDTEGFANFAITIKGADMAGLIRGVKPNQFRVSLRARDRLSVSRIAEALGGGGHPNAAGYLTEGTLDQVRKTLLKEVEKHLNL